MLVYRVLRGLGFFIAYPAVPRLQGGSNTHCGIYPPVYSSGFPRLFRVLVFSLHSARRLLERTWRRKESQLPYPNFLKSKPLTCLNARRKTQKAFSLGRYQANFFRTLGLRNFSQIPNKFRIFEIFSEFLKNFLRHRFPKINWPGNVLGRKLFVFFSVRLSMKFFQLVF